MSRRRLAAIAALAGALVLGAAAPAFAHVTVDPDEAPQGSFTKLAFNVPNETADAVTVKLEVSFPEDNPIAFVSVKPKAGWEATVDTVPLDTPIQSDDGEVTEAVSKITWEGGEIKPGEFDEFEVSVGPLPDGVDELVFPTIQTYDDGEEVSWIEPTPASGEEPEHPAPVLHLTASTGDEHGGSSEDAESDEGSGDSDSTDWVAVVALVVGAVGVALGGVALARGRRTT